MMMMMLMLIITSPSILKTKPFYIGAYVLRASNDPTFKDKFTFLVLNEDDTIKLKTIDQNGIIANKISRSGKIKRVIQPFSDTVFVKFSGVNKYSYSIFGIEIPELRYEQITNYTNQKTLNIVTKDISNSIMIRDPSINYYYIFDLNNANQKIKLPYIEISLATFISTQLISFIINLMLMKMIN
jgi:hypothetical protein